MEIASAFPRWAGNEISSLLQREHSSERHVRGIMRSDAILRGHGFGRRESGNLCRRAHRARRYSWRVHGVGRFDDSTLKKDPPYQVGDPFREKLLLEACLELMKRGAVVGIQDMGAAGLTSSSVEMAGRAARASSCT